MELVTTLRGLAAQGRADEAVRLVEARAESDDPEALFLLANWRLWGIQVPKDQSLGRTLLTRAVAAGHVEAARLNACLTANGTGGPADFAAGKALLTTVADRDPEAARQLDLLAAMSDADPAVETISTDPEIRLHRGAFSAAGCAWLAEKAGPALRPSMIRDPATGQGMLHPIRKSHGMYFDPSIEDLVVRAINLRLARLSGSAVECGEMLHIIRYGAGDEYRTHIDAMPGAENQRHLTALIYLNEDYEGGETRFTNLDLTVKGRTGDCLIFRNADANGSPDERMRHAGLPVTSGVKWLASRWIRQRPFDPSLEE